MDFFGIIYDMKNGKKVPYSKTYFDTLFAAKLGGSDVKTLTGALPLTFSTSEAKLRDWTIYGNNTQHNYSAEGTLPLTVTTHTAGAASDWVIYGNDENGTENFFGDYETFPNTHIANVNAWASYDGGGLCQRVKCEGNTEYTLSFANTSSLFRISASSTNDVPTANNPVIVQRLVNTTNSNSETFTTPNNAKFIIVQISYDEQELLNSAMLVKGSTAPDHYIPYQKGVGEQRVDGYYVPLTVSQQGQSDKTYDIYIGDSPLTEGENVSKTSTGVDIELFEGENTVSTTLYNKPETSITYTDYLGVGEYVNGQWQIPLTVTHYTDNIFDKDAKNTNKGYEDSTCIMWAGNIPYPYMTGNISEDNNCFVSEKIPVSPNTTYYLTDGIFKNTDNGIYSVFLWNRQRMSDYQAFPTEKTFTTGDDTRYIQICVLKAYADTVMITTKPTETYIPHVEVNNVNVPIDAPLTEGQSVSDTVEITAYEGENVLDTTLDNKPQMSITYKGG